MIVECFYSNGESITTGFNGTFGEAYSYFVGKIFNIGSVNDNMQKCTNIKMIPEMVDFEGSNITVCFIGDMGFIYGEMKYIKYYNAPYYQGQDGYKIEYKFKNSKTIHTKTFFNKPDIIVLNGLYDIPESVFYTTEGNCKKSRYTMHSKENITAVEKYCIENCIPYQFI